MEIPGLDDRAADGRGRAESRHSSERELAAAAEEVRRRLLHSVRPAPKPRHDVAAEDLRDRLGLQVADRQLLVVVLAAEHGLRGRRDVQVLEGPRAHELAAPQLLDGGGSGTNVPLAGRLRMRNGFTSQPRGPNRSRIAATSRRCASSSSPSTTIAVSSASSARARASMFASTRARSRVPCICS